MRPLMRWLFAPLAVLVPMLGSATPTAVAYYDPHSATDTPQKSATLGTSAFYRAIGELPMMHEGRIKPIDTVAREEIKQIYTRETIKLRNPDGTVRESWTPVAAFLDWSVRPKYWDAQPIIPVEYLPLKRMIFAGEVHEALDAIAAKSTTPAAVGAELKELAHSGSVDAAQIRNIVRSSGLPAADGESLLTLARRIGEETKYFSPTDLEDAQVTVDEKTMPLLAWLDTISRREGGPMGSKPKRTPLEEKAVDLALKIAHYRAIRDREALGIVPLLAMPRPANDAMIQFAAAAIKKVRAGGEAALDPLETETLAMLKKFLQDIPGKERSLPTEDAAFDTRYKQWLKDKSAWVPVQVVRGAAIEELTSAGFPTAKVEAFRTAFKAVESEELLHPGTADVQPALALIQSAHDLGGSINADSYPSLAEMSRESLYNRVAPFYQAPFAYGAGMVLLLASLMTGSFSRSFGAESTLGRAARGMYLLGMAAFAAGIGLETFGFYLRVRITGWAPVSNMAETVIWVALMVALLGLVIEAISRKTYAALGATGISLLATLLAANFEMLDPSIKQLPPVLRENFWLLIHVLTIVSSYAAFALAMGLGLIATTLYLVTTYKRSSNFSELAMPLAVGVPILGVGAGLAILGDQIQLGSLWARYGYYSSLAIAGVGLFVTGMGVFALLGEAVNRLTYRPQAGQADLGLLARSDEVRDPVANPVATDAEWRARVMSNTAGQIKLIASFIYRSMQVGILLVAAGTFLGGWWADKSWGRFWGWDPKEVWALITLLVYLMPLHGRFAGWVNTFWMVMASLVCFLSVLMAWYGVNYVLGVGLHSYGFGSGSDDYGQFSVAAVTVVVLSFAAGAYWRRKMSSQSVATLA